MLEKRLIKALSWTTLLFCLVSGLTLHHLLTGSLGSPPTLQTDRDALKIIFEVQLAFVLVSVLLSTVLFYLTRKIILQPTHALSEAFARMKNQGNAEIILETNDELQDLALAFNDMAREVYMRTQGLEQAIKDASKP
jgi:nitrate/nitrite-specific signal transduction histidine kinase